ncbi:MAG TPA: DUF1553 domain-containing protein [Candidatus Hydrogenedentes bacterium]|nr:DUF1553 domain-containing protein [Candidatus Hydrogenedentota bacterium]
MTRPFQFVVAFALTTLAPVLAFGDSPAAFTVLPNTVTLTHAGATHALVVERISGSLHTGDATPNAVFTSSNPAVADVDAKGIVRAVGNGESTITATVDGQSIEARVTVTGTEKPFTRSFRNHVQPLLFKTGCNTGACHGAAAGKNGFRLSLRGYDHDWDYKSLTRQANGRRMSQSEPEESLILQKATMGVPHGGGERFSKDSESYRILLEWISSGAPAMRADDPIVDRVEAMPKAVTLTNGASQQIVVQAHYNTGAYDDVTRWVKFDTTNDAVAIVDDYGKITVTGPGAAAITVWYASKVTTVNILVPRETPIAPERFAQAESKNYIDELVLRQLKSLQIAPAGLANDAEFIRRATIDATGVLPKPEDVTAFVADTNPRKRSALIAKLLESPEYVDYWSYKWSDLLLLSSKNIPKRDELNSFYRFIRESVASNKPWNEFTTALLTASGSTIENGAANYLAMHKETVDVTETTSQAFLGFSITCARCHNHPLEKWTQDDYYGMANLFSRVKYKNDQRSNGTDVLVDTFGDILHPRIGEPVAPRPLDGEPLDITSAADRRVELAAWLTSPENPYFTRAIANRVWRNFMGRGLVEPEDDLRLTNPATNEPLLDALADDLADHGYDLKHLMRSIMESAAYQRSSEPSDPAMPDNRYYSQHIVRRMSAEVILDAYSQVTNVPTQFDGYPGGFRALQLPDSQVGSYFLTAFGRPQRAQTCSCERTQDSSIAQTLHVANGDTLNKKLSDERSFLTQMVNDNVGDNEALDAIYLKALARPPRPDEREKALAILAALPKDGEEAKTERRLALEDITWAILSGKEFLFNH